MPHFGLMEEKKLGPVAGPLQRARLHMRGGRRRLRQGKTSAGIVTLYDALQAAMEWSAAKNGAKLLILPRENLQDEKVLYRVLARSGIVTGKFDYEAFDRLAERALNEDLNGDYSWLVPAIDEIMGELGVLPFDEASLPPEDPSTF